MCACVRACVRMCVCVCQRPISLEFVLFGSVFAGGLLENPSSQAGARSPGASLATRGTKPRTRRAVALEGRKLCVCVCVCVHVCACVCVSGTDLSSIYLFDSVFAGDSPEIPSSQAGARSAGASVATRGTKPQTKKCVVRKGR